MKKSSGPAYMKILNQTLKTCWNSIYEQAQKKRLVEEILDENFGEGF